MEYLVVVENGPTSFGAHVPDPENLNIRLHCLVLDGVVRRTEGEPRAD